MTPDPLPVALPELPTVAWLVEFGAVSLPKGHPSRITAFEAHHSEADALDSAHCLEYDSLVFDVVRKSDAEAALRAQAEEVAALRADAERLSFLQDWPGCNLISDDGGRWSVSETGFQPVAPDGGFKDTVGIQSLVFVH